MAFRRLDADAFTADKPVSSAHLTYLRDCVAACRSERLRSCSVGWDVRNAPLCSGVGSDQDAGERGILPLLWRKSRAEVTEITVRIRAENPSNESCWVDVKVLSMQELLDRPSLRSIASAGELELTASSTWGQGAGSWVVDVRRYRAGELLVLLLVFRSDFGDTEVLYINATPDLTGLTLLAVDDMRVLVDKSATWDGSTAQADEAVPYRIVFGVCETAGGFNAASFDPNTDGRVNGGNNIPLPAGQHLLTSRTDASLGELYVWPGFSGTFGLNAGDAVARQEAGYIRLRGAHVEETAVDAITTTDNGLAPAVAASAARVGLLEQELEDVYVLQDGPLAMSSQPSTRADSNLSLLLTNGPNTIVGFDDDDFGSYKELTRWVVGKDLSSFRDEDASSSQGRNTWVVDALVMFISRRQDWQPTTLSVDWALVATDTNDGNSLTGSKITLGEMQAAPYAGNSQGANLASDLTKQAAYLGALRRGATDLRHSLRDIWPQSVFGQLPLYRISLRITVTNYTTFTLPRQVSLQFKPTLVQENGSSTDNVYEMILVAALLDTLPSNDPALLGGS